MWTKFLDMCSGGGIKVPPYEEIYIQAPRKDAIVVFYNMFGRNPDNVTCSCCGEDYRVSEFETLEQATAFGCRMENMTPAEYVKREDVLIISKNAIAYFRKAIDSQLREFCNHLRTYPGFENGNFEAALEDFKKYNNTIIKPDPAVIRVKKQ